MKNASLALEMVVARIVLMKEENFLVPLAVINKLELAKIAMTVIVDQETVAVRFV